MFPSLVNTHKQAIIKIAQENDISYLALYGSYSRGEATKESDLDFLVSFDKQKGLFDLIDIEQKFSELVGVKVDLVTRTGLNRYIKPYIQDDLRLIYEKKS